MFYKNCLSMNNVNKFSEHDLEFLFWVSSEYCIYMWLTRKIKKSVLLCDLEILFPLIVGMLSRTRTCIIYISLIFNWSRCGIEEHWMRLIQNQLEFWLGILMALHILTLRCMHTKFYSYHVICCNEKVKIYIEIGHNV